ncbi:hypothetical protein PGN80_13155 [Klebsiella aerogenes]|uniref:hypothetical protein n=1 Tax=Klebsiella aerogenes TaxID=548 RepID=UPI00301D67D0
MQLTTKAVALAVIGVALAGCDNSDKRIVITDSPVTNKAFAASVIVDVSHFPDYVSVGGKRLYPDKDFPVDGANTEIAFYEFSKEESDGNDSILSTFTRVKLARCESGCVKQGLGWLTQKDFKPVTAWRTATGEINYAQYSVVDLANYNAATVISGEVKGWN